jgi:hypothetical protein
MIYVPVYNPAEIYGRWPDHDYLPVFVPPPPNPRSSPRGFGTPVTVGSLRQRSTCWCTVPISIGPLPGRGKCRSTSRSRRDGAMS